MPVVQSKLAPSVPLCPATMPDLPAPVPMRPVTIPDLWEPCPRDLERVLNGARAAIRRSAPPSVAPKREVIDLVGDSDSDSEEEKEEEEVPVPPSPMSPGPPPYVAPPAGRAVVRDYFYYGGRYNWLEGKVLLRSQTMDFYDKLWRAWRIRLNLNEDGEVVSHVINWSPCLWYANGRVPRAFGRILTRSRRFPIYRGCDCAERVQVKVVYFAPTMEVFDVPRPVAEVMDWYNTFHSDSRGVTMPPGFRTTRLPCDH